MKYPMSFRSGPPRPCLLAFVISFTFFLGVGYYVIATMPSYTPSTKKCLLSSCSALDKIPTLGVAKARYDNKRIIRIYDFHFTGNNWRSLVNRYDVCFATQASIERIYWLPHVLEKWAGPLSLSTYLTCEEEWLVFNMFMCYMSSCHRQQLNQISIHLSVPASITKDLKVDFALLRQWSYIDYGEIKTKRESCPAAKEYLTYLLDKFPTMDSEKLKLKEVYPQNHMRNIARKACGVNWTYSADIDIIPRMGMADMLQEFFETRKDIPCNKCAYVIPTFEINDTYTYPETKREVVNLFKTGAVQQFHGKYYSPGHKATDYDRWASTLVEDGPVQISHEILNDTSTYEPFYISSDDIPPFDERFLGYGFTRNSQWRAAQLAGWNFSVLTPVYGIHWGLQSSSTLSSPKKDGVGKDMRRQQTGKNYRIFEKVVKEMELKKELDIF